MKDPDSSSFHIYCHNFPFFQVIPILSLGPHWCPNRWEEAHQDILLIFLTNIFLVSMKYTNEAIIHCIINTSNAFMIVTDTQTSRLIVQKPCLLLSSGEGWVGGMDKYIHSPYWMTEKQWLLVCILIVEMKTFNVCAGCPSWIFKSVTADSVKQLSGSSYTYP